ncbi:diguanylate cyclase [Colwellia sp. RE-S-Sl-9]
MNNEKQKILIIDDDKSNLKILSSVLQDSAQIILAISGQQGLAKAVDFQPDLILLDVLMPNLNGFDLIIQLKSNPLISSIPVIFITGKNDSNSEEKGLRLGACDYIYKPFNVDILKARITLHLQLSKQRKTLENLANVDALTSIANRRLYDQVLEREWKTALRNQSHLSIIMIDIDHFKNYNDHYGHAAGDKVLIQVATTLKKNLLRPRDFIARYGGEEFIIILPETSADGAQHIVEGCRKSIEDLHIKHEDAITRDYLSISLGANSIIPSPKSNIEQFIKSADDMLYKAKERGRNCIVWNES